MESTQEQVRQVMAQRNMEAIAERQERERVLHIDEYNRRMLRLTDQLSEAENDDNEDRVCELEDEIEALKARKPIPVFDKAIFIGTMMPRPSQALLDILAPLTEKADILKAVFEYNNKPRKPKKYRVNKRLVAFVKAHNDAVNDDYVKKLEAFHREVKMAYNRGGGVGVLIHGNIGMTKGVTIEESILSHPLFKVTKIGEAVRTNYGRITRLGMRLVVTTREDVIFSYMGERLNFGKLTFSILLNRMEVKFIPKAQNFRDNAAPYLNGRGVCMGDNSYTFSRKLSNGKLFDALTELYTTMTVYNPHSTPYKALDQFFEQANKGHLFRKNGERAEVLK